MTVTESLLTDVLAVTPVHTAVMTAGGILASTHHTGIFLLLGAKDQVTPWFLHSQTNKKMIRNPTAAHPHLPAHTTLAAGYNTPIKIPTRLPHKVFYMAPVCSYLYTNICFFHEQLFSKYFI